MKQRVPLIVAIASLLLSIAYLIKGQQYPALVKGAPGPGLFPLTIGLFWLGVSLWSIVEVSREGPALAMSTEWADTAGWLRILVVLVTAALFILLLKLLGDLVVSFLSIITVMRAMGTKSPVRLFGTSVAVALVLHFLFVTELGVPLPQGLWNELR